MEHTPDLTPRAKLAALAAVARFRPLFAAGIVVFGAGAATLEGVGLSFIYPIMEVAQADGPVQPSGPIMETFAATFDLLGVPFVLETLVIGISLVMIVRFTASFLMAWVSAILSRDYETHLRRTAFDATLDAEVGYFDAEGSEDILNSVITETRYAGNVIGQSVNAVRSFFLMGVYLAIMLYIGPVMTVYAVVLLGGITYLLRNVIAPGYTVGDRVAAANQQIQSSVQAGTQGIRDVKLFTLADELFDRFDTQLETYRRSSINLARNKAAMSNGYDLAAALALFAIIYVGFARSGLDLGALGIFLFAMFRMAPLASRVNSQVYAIEGNLSHLVRIQTFLGELRSRAESGGQQVPDRVDGVRFDAVSFAYPSTDTVLDEVSLAVDRGEFIAFVGRSGAGKSTLVSLLTRMYDPTGGEITADGTPIDRFALDAWRRRLAVVRQDPYIFNDTLRANITIGAEAVDDRAVEQVAAIARIDEFLDELPRGYDTVLGDQGVRLSGGQRQRVALARALLMDADFLILDEATSDLDTRLEGEVHAAIEAMDRDFGIIAIAHRLSTVRNADRIYTLADGQIAEVGSHDQLIANEGEYAALHQLQMAEP